MFQPIYSVFSPRALRTTTTDPIHSQHNAQSCCTTTATSSPTYSLSPRSKPVTLIALNPSLFSRESTTPGSATSSISCVLTGSSGSSAAAIHVGGGPETQSGGTSTLSNGTTLTHTASQPAQHRGSLSSKEVSCSLRTGLEGPLENLLSLNPSGKSRLWIPHNYEEREAATRNPPQRIALLEDLPAYQQNPLTCVRKYPPMRGNKKFSPTTAGVTTTTADHFNHGGTLRQSFFAQSHATRKPLTTPQQSIQRKYGLPDCEVSPSKTIDTRSGTTDRIHPILSPTVMCSQSKLTNQFHMDVPPLKPTSLVAHHVLHPSHNNVSSRATNNGTLENVKQTPHQQHHPQKPSTSTVASDKILKCMDDQLKDLVSELPHLFKIAPEKSVFSGWEIINLLGSGTFASVYKVRHLRTGTIAAAKLLAPHKFRSSTQKRVVEMFSKEIRYSVVCQCPGVVEIKRVVRGYEGWLIIQNLIDGGTLWEDFECDSEAEKFSLFLQLLQAVLFMQDMSVVHRDLKPTNILRSSNGSRVWIADFGWSEHYRDINKHVRELPGTIEINPPEVLNHHPIQSEKIDNYALGMNLLLLNTHQFVCRDKELSTSDAANLILENIAILRKGRMLNGFTAQGWKVLLGLSEFDPNRRWSLRQVIDSPWFISSLSQLLPILPSLDSEYPQRMQSLKPYPLLWYWPVCDIANRLQLYLSPLSDSPLRPRLTCQLQNDQPSTMESLLSIDDLDNDDMNGFQLFSSNPSNNMRHSFREVQGCKEISEKRGSVGTLDLLETGFNKLCNFESVSNNRTDEESDTQFQSCYQKRRPMHENARLVGKELSLKILCHNPSSYLEGSRGKDALSLDLDCSSPVGNFTLISPRSPMGMLNRYESQRYHTIVVRSPEKTNEIRHRELSLKMSPKKQQISSNEQNTRTPLITHHRSNSVILSQELVDEPSVPTFSTTGSLQSNMLRQDLKFPDLLNFVKVREDCPDGGRHFPGFETIEETEILDINKAIDVENDLNKNNQHLNAADGVDETIGSYRCAKVNINNEIHFNVAGQSQFCLNPLGPQNKADLSVHEEYTPSGVMDELGSPNPLGMPGRTCHEKIHEMKEGSKSLESGEDISPDQGQNDQGSFANSGRDRLDKVNNRKEIVTPSRAQSGISDISSIESHLSLTDSTARSPGITRSTLVQQIPRCYLNQTASLLHSYDPRLGLQQSVRGCVSSEQRDVNPLIPFAATTNERGTFVSELPHANVYPRLQFIPRPTLLHSPAVNEDHSSQLHCLGMRGIAQGMRGMDWGMRGMDHNLYKVITPSTGSYPIHYHPPKERREQYQEFPTADTRYKASTFVSSVQH